MRLGKQRKSALLLKYKLCPQDPKTEWQDSKTDCPVRAKAVPLTVLPKNIQDALTEIEQQLKMANTKDDTVGQEKRIISIRVVTWTAI